MTNRSLFILVMMLGACDTRDRFEVQPSPDGQLTLTPSLHENVLVRLTVRDRSGRIVDEVSTGDTDVMKWVTGWVDNSSYLFWGSDTGASWVRHLDGNVVTESPTEGVACKRLEALFDARFHEHRGNFLSSRRE